MLSADLLLIFKTYAISLLLQLLAWPVVKKIFGKLPDEGWVLGRLFITLISALVIWQLSYLGFSDNSASRLFGMIALVGVVSIWIIVRQGTKAFTVSKTTLKNIAIEEYLFVVGFTLMGLVRAYAPSLDSLEKFMDFGFLKQYLVSPTLPAMDMWQAGMSINYYSFGHFWASSLVRVWGVSPGIGYNLVLAFIFGTSLSFVFLLCKTLIGNKSSRTSTLGGLMGSLSVLIAGNSHVIWYLIKNGNLTNYWYAEATRFIHNTIHEFPSYSFVVSDLHGHVLDLPVVLLFLIVLFYWFDQRKRVHEIFLGVLLGIMMMTNTWDVAVYGMVLSIVMVQIILSSRREIKRVALSASVIFILMSITSLPWWLSFKTISNGVGIVFERTPLWQLLALWGGGMIINIIAVITEGKGEHKIKIRALALSSLLLLAIPEFIYARDIYPNHPRANTMFKLTYQAFIMMGILLGVSIGKLMDLQRTISIWWRIPALLVTTTIFAGTMIFPLKAFPTYYGNFSKYIGLDGEAWIKTTLPENYGAIVYLESHRDGKNMVEAVGDSYSLLNSVSVFSGVPTIQGWRVHEWLWRGGYDSVAAREAEVREIYQGDNIKESLVILKKYNIGWILVGQDEFITYKVNEEKLWELGDIVWSMGDTYLIRVE
jgi:uncharacterized membrane protein